MQVTLSLWFAVSATGLALHSTLQCAPACLYANLGTGFLRCGGLRRRELRYARLPADLQWRLRQDMLVLLAEKPFLGCAGLRVTDEKRRGPTCSKMP